MKLNRIKLLNFRNYHKIDLKFKKDLTIITGKNAQGKTNLLESIYILALTKSYKMQQENNLIKFDAEKFIIEGEIQQNKLIKDLKITNEKRAKKVFVNKNEIKKISNYIGNFNVILSSPEDINIIKGSPNERRNLLNSEISQISSRYLKKLNEYNKILKTRNDYLKQMSVKEIADYRYLEVLTKNMIVREKIIYEERKKFIDKINENIGTIFENITKMPGLKVVYEKSLNYEENNDKIFDFYSQNKEKEIYQGMTLYGPHRDDLKFFLEDEDIKLFGSQGQQKLVMIAFKLAEISIFKEITSFNPVLLFDDVFSELDVYKKNKLIKYIPENMQVIITSNDTRGIRRSLLDRATIYNVENGKIEEKNDKKTK